MKPRNFPGRKKLRQDRAKARKEGRPMPRGGPHITQMDFRMGRKYRASELDKPNRKAIEEQEKHDEWKHTH